MWVCMCVCTCVKVIVHTCVLRSCFVGLSVLRAFPFFCQSLRCHYAFLSYALMHNALASTGTYTHKNTPDTSTYDTHTHTHTHTHTYTHIQTRRRTLNQSVTHSFITSRLQSASNGRWHVRRPSSYWLQTEWISQDNCSYHVYSVDEIKSCLGGKRVLFLGDSLTRNLWEAFANYITGNLMYG
jgi:hypothetical protein